MAAGGYVSVVAALVLALYGALAGPLGVKWRRVHLVRTAQYVVPAQFVLVTAAALALVYALVANDFTILAHVPTGRDAERIRAPLQEARARLAQGSLCFAPGASGNT